MSLCVFVYVLEVWGDGWHWVGGGSSADLIIAWVCVGDMVEYGLCLLTLKSPPLAAHPTAGETILSQQTTLRHCLGQSLPIQLNKHAFFFVTKLHTTSWHFGSASLGLRSMLCVYFLRVSLLWPSIRRSGIVKFQQCWNYQKLKSPFLFPPIWEWIHSSVHPSVCDHHIGHAKLKCFFRLRR